MLPLGMLSTCGATRFSGVMPQVRFLADAAAAVDNKLNVQAACCGCDRSRLADLCWWR